MNKHTKECINMINNYKMELMNSGSVCGGELLEMNKKIDEIIAKNSGASVVRVSENVRIHIGGHGGFTVMYYTWMGDVVKYNIFSGVILGYAYNDIMGVI